MLEEGIICPNCGANIEEMDLHEKLACPHCKKDLKDRNYLDFLEYLMANGIVENLDFLMHQYIVKILKDLIRRMKMM